MAIFEIRDQYVLRVKPITFNLEKELQSLIESNLKTFFNCRFVATEFVTGNLHAGRIDTLALSEDSNPVIIEYKKVASSELVNQSLYYLHWLTDHKGDFQLAVNKALGEEVKVEWSDVRVICIAPEFKKYDLHAVKMMGSNIELWQYKLYENGIISIEEVFRKSTASTVSTSEDVQKNHKMVSAGKKAAQTRKTAVYTIEEHTNKLNESLKELQAEIRGYLVNLDNTVEESPKQNYIAYKTSQNFACLEHQRKKIILFLKINPDEINPMPAQARDVRNIGHFATGDFEFTIKSFEDFEQAKPYIEQSLKNIGG